MLHKNVPGACSNTYLLFQNFPGSRASAWLAGCSCSESPKPAILESLGYIPIWKDMGKSLAKLVQAFGSVHLLAVAGLRALFSC